MDTITIVVQSDWVLEEYICELDSGETVFVYETDDQFAAISEMVASWPCEWVEAASYRVWTRPASVVE